MARLAQPIVYIKSAIQVGGKSTRLLARRDVRLVVLEIWMRKALHATCEEDTRRGVDLRGYNM